MDLITKLKMYWALQDALAHYLVNDHFDMLDADAMMRKRVQHAGICMLLRKGIFHA